MPRSFHRSRLRALYALTSTTTRRLLVIAPARPLTNGDVSGNIPSSHVATWRLHSAAAVDAKCLSPASQHHRPFSRAQIPAAIFASSPAHIHPRLAPPMALAMQISVVSPFHAAISRQAPPCAIRQCSLDHGDRGAHAAPVRGLRHGRSVIRASPDRYCRSATTGSGM